MQPRFRAIDPETGRVSRTFEITFHKSLYVLSEEAFIWEPRTKGLYCAMSTQDPILSQSTGLTDSRGREVFVDDVLISQEYPDWPALKVVWQDDRIIAIKAGSGEADTVSLKNSLVFYHVIGNTYMSPDTLRARAEGGGDA